MFNRLLQKLFPTPSQTPVHSGPYLSQTVVFGMHLYRTATEDSSVYYIDEVRGIRTQVVDKWGRILNFPGIEREEHWVQQVSERALQPQIRFRTDFEKRDGRFIMLWQIQPDGRYWEDEDGFGAESDEEVTLYSFLDENGLFTAPFRIYRIGDRRFETRP